VKLAVALWLLAGTLGAQDFSKLQIEKVDTGFRFAEGPVWSREGFLLFSDGAKGELRKKPVGERSTMYREGHAGASGLAFDGQGRLYVCESRARRVIRIDKKGQLEVLAEKWEGKRLNAPNDIVVRRDGHIYFTDPAFGDQSDTKELDFHGLYHINPKGVVEVLAKSTTRPNGLALSSNGRILYMSNSDERNVRAYDVDRNGVLSGERVLVAKTQGVPGGMCTDEKGNLYVAAKDLAVYSAAGKLIHGMELSEGPSNCAFGDPDLQTLYITARTSVFKVHLDVKGALQH
jgi:gluconolactonase